MVGVTSWYRGFFLFVVRVNFLASWVLYIRGSSKLQWDRGFFIFVVRVNFLVSGVLYIRCSNKFPGIADSLYSWFE